MAIHNWTQFTYVTDVPQSMLYEVNSGDVVVIYNASRYDYMYLLSKNKKNVDVHYLWAADIAFLVDQWFPDLRGRFLDESF